MRFAILRNGFDDNYIYWSKACQKYGYEYDIINLLDFDWLRQVRKYNYNCYLTCPPGMETLFKQMYDERVNIIENVLDKFLYPCYREILLHENKKFLSYWLAANDLPHPCTFVFYDEEEAKKFVTDCELPVVGKFNIGASGKGVRIFRDRTVLKEYIEKAFCEGFRQEWGPNFKMGNWVSRISRIFMNPSRILSRIEVYKKVYNELQKGYVILQEYIPHNYEWRIVKIGNSFFGHQKVKQGDKASGTKGIDYVVPPDRLLDFVNGICEKHKFNTMAVDLFEDNEWGFLINEMQCIFGHVQEYICEKDNKPGRLVHAGGKWVFEEGFYNSNLSYDLRLQNVMGLIKRK